MKSNRKITNFWLGLSFYLDQSQLSIHRSSWPEFKKYVKEDVYDIEEIVSALTEVTNLEVGAIKFTPKPKEKFFSRLSPWPRKLSGSEVNYVSYWLVRLKELLNSEVNPTQSEIGELRLNLAYAAGILNSKFSSARRENTPIAHLNQNEILKTKAMKDILDFDWP